MPSERSAGVVAYRLNPEKEPEYLLLDYGKYWDFAKGHVERGEDDLAAAIRELKEESGIGDVEIADGFRHEIQYFFRHKSKGLVRKSVVFFLGRTKATKLKISHEHVGGEFLSYEDALARLKYANAKETLKAAHAFLKQR